MSAVTVKYTPERGLPRNPGKPRLPSGVVLGGMVANEPHNVNLGVGDIEALKGCRGWSVKPYKVDTADVRQAVERQAEKDAKARNRPTERARHVAEPKPKPKAEKKEPKA